MKYALEFDQATKRYGRFKALDELTLRVPAGCVFGLVGSNGAGKTTALTAAAGLLRLHRGVVRVFGEGPFDPRKRPGELALLPQDAHFPPHARAREVLSFYAALQQVPAALRPGTIDGALASVNLADRARAPTRTLSHGMRRRLAIAQAFLGEPRLVLLDEPLNGLDPREVANIRELIRRKRGTATIVISSHMLSEIEALCDQVGIIERGRTQHSGPLAEFVQSNERVSIHVGPGAVPLDRVAAAVPEAKVTFDEARRMLSISFPAGMLHSGEVNARILPVLLEVGVEILEIRRGSRLEQVYLEGRPVTE